MKHKIQTHNWLIICILFKSLIVTNTANAWTQQSHSRMTQDALLYMGSDHASPDQKRAYNFYLVSAGDLQTALTVLGKSASEVDDFKDTRLGHWWSNYQHGLSYLIVNNNTSLWHFISIGQPKNTEDNDKEDYTGYSFQNRTKDPRIFNNDTLLSVFLYNQQLHYNDYITTATHYSDHGTPISYENYQKFQSATWEPIDHLADYWFQQFVNKPSFQSIAYVTHAAAEVAVAHHTWNTFANYHYEYETWVADFYDIESLSNFEQIEQALNAYNPEHTIRDIVTQSAKQAYCLPEPLYDPRHQGRLKVAKTMIPSAIATIVTVLTKAVNNVYGEDANDTNRPLYNE